MNAKEFFDKVCEMRMAQKTYFKNRTQENLDFARTIEREIDREIKRVEEIMNGQQSLFPEENKL